MRIIGVIDLRGGRAVHAQGGRRDRYEPIAAVGTLGIEPGSAVDVAQAYAALSVPELYVADLDAIECGRPQRELVSAIARIGRPVWLDAGISCLDDAHRAIDLGVQRVVVGLETLSSYDALQEMCTALGPDRVAFSLDLRDGRPLRILPDAASPAVADGACAAGRGAAVSSDTAPAVAGRAAAAGAGAVIVLDLARVGSAAGFDAALLARVRLSAPEVDLVAGGGIRGHEDLHRLAALGYDGALIATALLRGQLTATDVAAAEHE